MTTTASRPKRADAVRNRERVVAAAAQVFAEKGLEAAVPEIAARAGVGKATVYRSFPSKEHLAAAVVMQRLGWFGELVDEALAEDDDAGAAFERVLHAAARAQCGDHSLVGALAASIELPEVVEARAGIAARLDLLIRRGQRQGTLRDDITWADVRVLFSGVATVLHEAGEGDEAVWDRYVGLIVDAVRA
jgi:AcrR family transcriptional regulator